VKSQAFQPLPESKETSHPFIHIIDILVFPKFAVKSFLKPMIPICTDTVSKHFSGLALKFQLNGNDEVNEISKILRLKRTETWAIGV